MSIPPFQTVLKIVAGAGPVPTARFVWGTPAAPFSVGSRGDWVVQAPGVEGVHFFMAFDGRLIQASGLPTGPSVLLNGVPVGQSWTPVPVSSELCFGDARVTVRCEELGPTEPAVPAERHDTRFMSDQPAASPAVMNLGVNRTVAISGPQGAAWAPKVAQSPAASAAPASPETARAPGLGLSPGLSPGFSPVPHLSRVLAPEVGAPDLGWPGTGAPAQPATAPKTQESERIRGLGRMEPLAPDSARPVPLAMLSRGRPFETVSDAGALRQQASPIGSEPPAPGFSDATQGAPLKTRLSPDSVSDPGETRARDGFAPAVPQYQAAPPAAAPLYESPQARGHLAAASPLETGSSPQIPLQESPLLKAWRETSWPKRAVLLLLPFAAYFGVFYEPASPEVATKTKRARQATTAVTTASAVAPVAAISATSAQVAPAPQATTAPVADAPTAQAGAVTAASPTAAMAPPAEVASAAVPSVAKAPKAEGAASKDKEKEPSPERDALDAAFEGRLTEAADRYQQLASGANAQKFSLAARYVREQAVRTP